MGLEGSASFDIYLDFFFALEYLHEVGGLADEGYLGFVFGSVVDELLVPKPRRLFLSYFHLIFKKLILLLISFLLLFILFIFLYYCLLGMLIFYCTYTLLPHQIFIFHVL